MSPLAAPLLWVLAIPAGGSSLYLLVLTLLSARNKVPPPSRRTLQFDVIVPAHNEEAGIASVVKSTLAIDWPRERFRVVVVADNCTDDTARVAGEAGAQVIVRHNAELRGKGYALAHAFQESRERGVADAVVVVDADSVVSPNLLEAIATRIERGEQAVQVHYGVSNIHASWRTRLMAIAMGAFHLLRSRARERLGLSCGIRGNGWALTHALLQRVPYASYSLTEDLEFGIELGMHGIRVAYADEAHCDGEMVSGEKAARSQRRRWEQGRIALLGSRVGPLIIQALKTRSLLCLDLAIELLVLPLSYVVLNILALALVGWWLAPQSAWPWTGVLCLAAVAIYVLRGWQLSGTGLRGLLDLMRAPIYLVWKLVVMLKGWGSSDWIRTKREGT